MGAYAMLRQGGFGKMTCKQIEEGMDGNLCRCTGYRPILDALKTFAIDPPRMDNITITDSETSSESSAGPTTPLEEDPMIPIPMKEATAVEGHQHATTSVLDAQEPIACGKGADCCRMNGKACGGGDEEPPKLIPGIPRFTFKSYNPTAEPIFPPWLKRLDLRTQNLVLVQKRRVRAMPHDLDDGYSEGEGHDVVGSVWLRPGSVDSLIACLKTHPDAKIRAGNSETGIEKKFKGVAFPVSIYVSDHLAQLATIEVSEAGMRIGSALSLTDVIAGCKKALLEIEGKGARFILQAIRLSPADEPQ